jgi:GrpB-like predicted nucleotidyltransferase (UPF0157 family)
MYEACHEDFVDFVRFRNDLRTHPGDARTYEQLKLRLDVELAGEPARYQDEKRSFIDGLLATPRP